jgi:isopentenyl phosphate kinase
VTGPRVVSDATGAPKPYESGPLVRSRTRPTMLVLKIGGSLFSDKRRKDGLDNRALVRWASVVAALARQLPGRLVFVTGGGSVGHGAVANLDARDLSAAIPLTHAVFGLKVLWVEALHRCGIRAMPLQLAAMASLTAHGLCVQTQVVQRLLDAAILPVLSGDCVVTADGSLHVVGSDRVPEGLLDLAGPHPRVVMLTDVPGIFADGPHGNRLLESIDPTAPGEALDAVRASASWDTSSSMAGKLAALLIAAERGAECFVMHGDPEGLDLGFLGDPLANWPPRARYTLIARDASQWAAATSSPPPQAP